MEPNIVEKAEIKLVGMVFYGDPESVLEILVPVKPKAS